MHLSFGQLAKRLGITIDDVTRLMRNGVIERPQRYGDRTNKFDGTAPKLAEILSLTPDQLTARRIVNTSLLFKKEN